MISPTCFRVEFRKYSSGSTMFSKPIKFQIDVMLDSVLDNMHKVIFTLITGEWLAHQITDVSDFKYILDQLSD